MNGRKRRELERELSVWRKLDREPPVAELARRYGVRPRAIMRAAARLVMRDGYPDPRLFRLPPPTIKEHQEAFHSKGENL